MASVALTCRRLLIAAALGLGLCRLGAPWAAGEAAVVRIESAPGGQSRAGSGFVVQIKDDGAYVVTAAHVVEGDPAPRLYFSDRPYLASIARVLTLEGGNPEGLALLLVETGLPSGLRGLPMAPGGGDDLEPGEAVRALGVPAGLRTWAQIPGNVVAWKDRDILFSGGVDEGNSGGPLLKGAAVAGLVMAQEGNFGLAVPASSLKRFLKSNGVAWAVDAPAGAAPTRVQPPAPPKAGETFRDCPDCPDMVVVPAGSFQMGSPDSEKGHDADEGPVHRVTFDRPFAIGKYEVTFDPWDACVEGKGCEHRPNHQGWGQGSRPVIDVNWDDAQAYLRWLGKKTGKPYRLPSEAEWEYAARAQTKTARFWGEDPAGACRYANGYDETGEREKGFAWEHHPCDDRHAQTAPVGRFDPNGFGLHDMLGNVWEWTQDCQNDSYQDAPTDGSAWTQGECMMRVIRGGSWDVSPRGVRATIRDRDSTAYRDDTLGFRPARSD